jgi:lon-related putative ATP-dependent protease
MSAQSLPPGRLRRVCAHEHFTFATTADLEATDSIIGQPRGTRAIEFGINIRSHGYNMFVMGDVGTGRTTTIKKFLEDLTNMQPPPADWIYVHNFAMPHKPRAIKLPPGDGAAFQEAMNGLLACLRDDLPKAFDTDAYYAAQAELDQRLEDRQEALLAELRQEAAQLNFALTSGPAGPIVTPVAEGKMLSPEQFQQLPLEQQQTIMEHQETLDNRLDEVRRELRQLDNTLRADFRALDRRVADAAIEHHFVYWQGEYAAYAEIRQYLAAMRKDILDSLADFRPDSDADQGDDQPPDLRRYQVNLFVDNSLLAGAPVVVESNPAYHNLLGRIEYELRYGVMSTHFMNLKPGSLHRANGGYLVINSSDLENNPAAWEALKRALRDEEIKLQTPDQMDGMQVLAKSLDPEPIPLSLKVILLGNPELYYWLHEEDEDFRELFKVKADFDSVMPRNEDQELQYAYFIAHRCQKEGLSHFDRPAVEKVIEYGSRLAGHQERLSTHFGEIADLVREAGFWASYHGRDLVQAQDVQAALRERIYRANRLEEQLRENIADRLIFIDTSGNKVGQVNGLSVLDLSDYTFGQPGRITARVYLGEDGVVNIEREVDMAGPIHNKGLLTLVGYLGGQYAQQTPLSLSASLTFEQNYAGVDGDSASAAELFALLSELSQSPLRQDVAVTGSINQRGDIQPVGGVTEKIEGFYRVCRDGGLTGTQGVLIPAANVCHLMLDEEVVDAVAKGEFHVWAINNVDEGINLLTGREAGERDGNGHFPEDTLHHAVQERLQHMAIRLKTFTDDEEHDE